MSAKDNSLAHVLFFDDFVRFYEQSPLRFPATDIFCCGQFNTSRRLAALINVLCMMRDQERRFPIVRITVVFPPISTKTLAEEESYLRNAVRDVMTQLHGRRAAASQMGFLKGLLSVKRCSNLEVDTAIRLIQCAERLSVVIFLGCAKYRQQGLTIERPANDRIAMISEDLWVHHLRSFAACSVDVAAQRSCYVVLDAGEASPYRKENTEILRTVDHCGVLGSRIVDDPRETVVSRLDEWAKQIESGRIGSAFSAIDSLPESLRREKRLLKIQLLSRAGLPAQMLEFLHQELGEIPEIDPEVLVNYSRFAGTSGDSELATQFLTPAIPILSSEEKLELALSVCSEIDNTTLEATCLRQLETLFPNSHLLHRHRLANLIDSQQYAEAAVMLSKSNAGLPMELTDFYKELVFKLEGVQKPDYDSILAIIGSRWPTLLGQGQLVCAADARARGLPKEALSLLLPEFAMGRISRRLVMSCLQSLEQLLVQPADHGKPFKDEAVVREAVLELIRYLASNPEDGSLRGGLVTVLSPQISGTTGLFLIAMTALDLSTQDTAIRRDHLKPDGRSVDLGDLPKFLEPILRWMEQESPIVIGRCILPTELLATPADSLMDPIKRLLQGEASKLADEGDISTFEKLLFAAVLVAGHSSNPSDDLNLIRLGAAKLALAGRVQKARDLIEQGLQIVGKNTARTRLAWFAFADVYQRLNNPVDALLGMTCTLACKAEITTEQAWYETYLLIRLLRDLHMPQIAKSLLPVGEALLEELGEAGEYQHRFVTLELSLRLVELLDDSAGREVEVQEFVADAEKLCTTVLQRNDEIAPSATLLAQGIYLCRLLKIHFHESASCTLESVLAKVGEPLSSLIRTLTIQTPLAASVLSLARRLEPARYASDTGFDLRYIVIAARRLLDSGQAAADSRITALSIELLADQALRRPVAGTAIGDALHGVPASIQEPAELAEEFSRLGISVVLLGLNTKGNLVRVTAKKGSLGTVTREDPAVFSKARFDDWSKQFPYGYADVPETDNIFHTSMRGLGLTIAETGRVLFVMDAALQQLAPNLLLVSNEFVGRTIPVAAAPSLAWLRAALAGRRKTSGQNLAWIPSVAKEGGDTTLSMVAERLKPTLTANSIKLEVGSEIPRHLSGSAFVMVAAHGGIMPEGRFFRVVANDADLRITSAALTKCLRGVELVILFVCSGGRFDRHPFANTTVGLAKDLLNHGCMTVIASPWPLDARVPSHWLPQFLALWEAGYFVVDANFEANKAVEKAMGNSPARCLAMTVFGDPLLVKQR